MIECYFSHFRIKFFLLHVSFSLVIAILSVILVFGIWYPSPLQIAVGVTHVYLIMLSIYFALGPLLTFILAKEGKKGLNFDLIFVIVLQSSSLFYGLYHIAMSRPVWIAFDTIRFDVVQADEIDDSDIKKALPIYQHVSWLGPKYIAVRLPQDNEERNKRLFNELSSGITPSMQPQLYEPLYNAWSQISVKQSPFSELMDFNNPSQVNQVLSEYPNATGWLALKAYKEPMVILIDTDNHEVLDIVDLRPWK